MVIIAKLTISLIFLPLTKLAKSPNMAILANLLKMENKIMRIESATNAKNHFGEIMDAALREPVMIQRSGRDVAVLLSAQDYKNYEEFEALSDKYWGEMAMEAMKEEPLGAEESEKILQKYLNAKT